MCFVCRLLSVFVFKAVCVTSVCAPGCSRWFDSSGGTFAPSPPSLLTRFTVSVRQTLKTQPRVDRRVRVCRRVEEVVRYPSLPPRRQLTYQAKQTISREMEQEKMRRAEQLIQQRNPAAVRHTQRWRSTGAAHAARQDACLFSVVQKPEEKKKRGPTPTTNHQQRLENIVRQTRVEARVRRRRQQGSVFCGFGAEPESCSSAETPPLPPRDSLSQSSRGQKRGRRQATGPHF